MWGEESLSTWTSQWEMVKDLQAQRCVTPYTKPGIGMSINNYAQVHIFNKDTHHFRTRIVSASHLSRDHEQGTSMRYSIRTFKLDE